MAGLLCRPGRGLVVLQPFEKETFIMSKQLKIPAEMRTDVGKGASRRLRRAGRVPAVVYGADRDPATITLDHAFLLREVEKEAFHSSVLELQVGDKSQQVVLRDLQRHPFKLQLTHLDFMRISEDQVLRMPIPLHFTNEEQSPAKKKAGVVISHQAVEVEIECLPKDLPEHLVVDLATLEPGESVMLSEIPLPEGVIIPLLAYEEEDEDLDYSVVTAIFIRAGQGTGELAAEADAALGEGAEVATVGDEEAGEDKEAGDDQGDQAAEGESSED